MTLFSFYVLVCELSHPDNICFNNKRFSKQSMWLCSRLMTLILIIWHIRLFLLCMHLVLFRSSFGVYYDHFSSLPVFCSIQSFVLLCFPQWSNILSHAEWNEVIKKTTTTCSNSSYQFWIYSHLDMRSRKHTIHYGSEIYRWFLSCTSLHEYFFCVFYLCPFERIQGIEKFTLCVRVCMCIQAFIHLLEYFLNASSVCILNRVYVSVIIIMCQSLVSITFR